jgi:hypothetical protein
MAAGSAPVAAAAADALGPVNEFPAEIFSIASVMDTEGPTRANELTAMPRPVATPEGAAAAAFEDEPRDYTNLLLNPGT